MDWLIVSVDVEKDKGEDTSLWQTILLYSPSASFIVQLHIESSVLHQGLDDSTKYAILGCVVECLYQKSMIHCVLSS